MVRDLTFPLDTLSHFAHRLSYRPPMKLKTTLIASDGETSVSLTVESVSSAYHLTRHEQEHNHERAVNSAHATLLGRFNVLQIKVR